MFDGVITIYKPKGMTSHDVVSRVRKIARMKKVGHTGTLDPMAEGVLPVCLGKGTRIAEYLTGEDKTYLARIRFGQETDTLDAEGKVVRECPLPTVSKEVFSDLVNEFLGPQMQMPPQYAAIKVEGKPLYRYAREGVTVEVPPRAITIHSLVLHSYDAATAEILVHCSKGTYIRSLARDIALRADSCGHLEYLQRTQSGYFTLKEAVSLETLAEEGVAPHLRSIDQALPEVPAVYLEGMKAEKARLGNQISPDAPLDIPVGTMVKIFHGEALIGLGVWDAGLIKPKKIFV